MTVWDSDHWDSTLGTESTRVVTPEGAAWLASASAFPRSVLALWSARPGAPSVLPCGTTFDVINMPVLFGRRVLDAMWSAGSGRGPAAVHLARLLIFARPGTADRLPSLMSWEEWASRVPPLLCHGKGDAVTIPPLHHATDVPSRWVVPPDSRQPWLPGADVLLWACIRATRAEATAHAEAAQGASPPRLAASSRVGGETRTAPSATAPASRAHPSENPPENPWESPSQSRSGSTRGPRGEGPPRSSD